MKIISAKQLHEADKFTLKEQNIHSHYLMERASKVFSNWYLNNFNHFNKIHIICGIGNNGGDGLCIARHLIVAGKDINVFISGETITASNDFKINFERLKRVSTRITYCKQENLPELQDCDCIIDALLGTGLRRPVEGFNLNLIESINTSAAFVISIDLPSGLAADEPVEAPCVEANITFSFESPKLCFFFPENEKYIGQWIVKNIGISNDYINQVQSPFLYLTAKKINEILRPRTTFSHKGSYGHVLIVAGKPGMPGASELCGFACLTAGAGLVTISSDETKLEHPELMMIKRSRIHDEIEKNKYDVLAIGPGLGNNEESFNLLKLILENYNKPLVLDADALNILAEHKELFSLVPKNSILTPHPKEFERLFGKYETWKDLIHLLISNAEKHNVIIIYKRAFSIIATPEGNIFFNSTGNSGMATAGSGDVLTGIIASLLAQKYKSDDAALLGAYLHGLAGDLAMMHKHGQNLIAGDIIENIQHAFSAVNSQKKIESVYTQQTLN